MGVTKWNGSKNSWGVGTIIAVYWFKKKERGRKRGRRSQRADAFYLLEDVFPESTGVCIS